MRLPCRILGGLWLTFLITLQIGKGLSVTSTSTGNSAFPEIADAPLSCSSGNASSCIVDSYIGSKIIFEDETTRIWNFTLGPGEMTSMHRHDCAYHFLAVNAAVLEVWGETGEKLLTIGEIRIDVDILSVLNVFIFYE
jgi:hypothetical protein